MELRLSVVAADWKVALDAAAEAIDASAGAYSSEERVLLRHRLARERVETARLLERVASYSGGSLEDYEQGELLVAGESMLHARRHEDRVALP